MTISYSDLVEKLLFEARDVMRADSTLCTLLGTTTVLSKNIIFSQRPVDQRKGFTNPRIVCEAPTHNPLPYGKSDGYRDDTVKFQITGWVNDTPIETAPRVMERIRTLFDQRDFSITEGGTGTFAIQSVQVDPDPDKTATMQCRVLINAENIIAKR